MMDATRRGLFRRLRHAISRDPLVPRPATAASAPLPWGSRPAGGERWPDPWLRLGPECSPQVEHIIEPVWILEPDGAD